MTKQDLKAEIKRCHPDHRSGDHSRVGRFQKLMAALRDRCPVCGEPKPAGRSPSRARIRETCGQLCALKLRYYSKPIAALACMLLAFPVLGEKVNVAWDASPSPDVTSYTITLKQGTNAQQKINLTGLVASLTLTNKTELYVQAVNSAGLISDPSNTVIWEPTPVTNAPPSKPLPPGAVRVTTVTTTTIIETQ